MWRSATLRSGSASANPASSPDFREEHELRNHDGLELLGQIVELGVGHGDVPPVRVPCGVVQHADACHFGLELLEVERPDLDLVPLRQPARDPLEPLRDTVGLMVVRDEVLRLREAVPLDQIGVPWRVIRHHHDRRRVEPLHEQPAFLVHGETGRPSHDRQPARCEPRRDGGEQRGRDLGLALALEESEESRSVVVLGEVRIVLDGRDPPHDLSRVVPRQKELDLGVLMKRVVLVEHVRDIAPERRDPERIVAIQPVRQLDERAEIGSPPHRLDVDQPCLRTPCRLVPGQPVDTAIVR
jgi:hypothetical protein